MTFSSRLIPSALLLGTSMIIYGVWDIACKKKSKTQMVHIKQICEICGIVENTCTWSGIGIENEFSKKRLVYECSASAILCDSCRNQSKASYAWQLLQKKQT